ncbi:MAG: prepilin-type N-terminal cleavage/methylation domain-containing protein [Betaproteobacteria bacterium]
MTSPRSSAGRVRGFTLLETLVALTLLAMILAVLTGSIRFAGQSRDAVATKLDGIDNMRIAQDFLRQTITQAHPKRWLKVVGRPFVFRGERDELALAAPLTARVGVGGLFLLKFSLVDSGEKGQGKKLVMARVFPEPTAQEMPDFSTAETTVLAENLSELEIAYLGRDDETADPTWRDDWKEGARMPEAVRLRIRTDKGAAWPELIVPLRVVPRPRGNRRA